MEERALVTENIIMDDINERLSGRAVNTLTSGQRSRLFKALDGNFVIYPVQPNVYNVVSVKENQENSKYTVSVFDRPQCECLDYVLRCVEEDRWCKHILRVWAEIRVGELPLLGVNPSDWLRARLEDELLRVLGRDEEAAVALREAYHALDDDLPDAESYRRATLTWRQYRENPP